MKLEIWADAVAFVATLFGGKLAIVRSPVPKYFMVLSDDVEIYRRVFLFFAVKCGDIDLARLKFHMGSVNWSMIGCDPEGTASDE